MAKMRAAQVVSAKGPYKIVERETPEPPRARCASGCRPPASATVIP
jgi:hypothetical protein